MEYIGKIYGKFGREYIEIDITEDLPKKYTKGELLEKFKKEENWEKSSVINSQFVTGSTQTRFEGYKRAFEGLGLLEE